ncbi:hypothetical protein PIB30_013271 [Stylosanthes scabra]|uniref:KIB1-4 beta-propeller domain-containing protein n=1 Tax=Stylosanthes scabra TaxID=79078 RepID=A0ABU6R6K4_9FABA|nr:hypothetical protein [Stylosanthes scabra]
MGGVDQWASIHQDMLSEIAKLFYSYDEYLQLGLVCKQWNFKLPKIPGGNKIPWLLLPIGSGATRKPFEASTLEEEDMQLPTIEEEDGRRLEEKGIYHLTLPELQDNLTRGSCHGWIIMVLTYEGIVRMLNPFTKVCFDLPPISTLPNVIDIHGDKCTIDLGDKFYTLETTQMHKLQVWKVITNLAPNNDDFMAVIVYAWDRNLAFYKPNDRRWLKFPTTHKHILDVIFFHDKIYAADNNHQLYEFHIDKKTGPVGRIYEATPPSLDLPIDIFHLNYLIGCDDGSLLMLIRHFHAIGRAYYETIKFDVYKLNKNEKVWSRIYNLGNYVLVVGLNSSVQIFASNFLNCKGNTIYFTDNPLALQSLDIPCHHDIGIFNLEDGSCHRLLADVNFVCPPIWILP